MPQSPVIPIIGPTILAGGSLSDTLALSSYFIVGVVTPTDWTPAVATVQVSPDGVRFYDLYDPTGHEFNFNVSPNALITIHPYLMLTATYLKIRSGTRDDPIPQQNARQFTMYGTQNIALQEAAPP